MLTGEKEKELPGTGTELKGGSLFPNWVDNGAFNVAFPGEWEEATGSDRSGSS